MDYVMRLFAKISLLALLLIALGGCTSQGEASGATSTISAGRAF